MTVVAIVLLVLCLTAAGGAAHPRTRRFFLTKKLEPLALPAAESDSLRQWRQVFRETVVATEGKLSREMEDFLADPEEIQARFLAEAVVEAEKRRAELLKKTEDECAAMVEKAKEQRALILEENNDASPSRRPLLVGGAMWEFRDDYNASKTEGERYRVIERWHSKGFRFPRVMRKELLDTAANEGVRVALRRLFDQQDTDVGMIILPGAK